MARKLPRFLTIQEVQAMLKASEENERDNILLKTLFYLGLRNSEAMSLNIEDIDIPNRIVKVVQGKGKKDRYVPIPTKEFAEELQRYIGERRTGKLFYISDRHIRRIVKKYAIKAGLRKPEEIHPHTLRHSYATFLQNQGTPLNIIQEILGHARIDTTTIYVHLAMEKKREFVEKAFEFQKIG